MDFKKLMLIMVAVFCSFTVKAASVASETMQGVTVTGTVNDAQGDPMPGVNVVIKGTTIGVTSDFNGRYSINLPNQDAVLMFSFIGYRTEEVAVGNRTVIDVIMEEAAQEIEEVVVVGYGVQKRTHLTGSVSQIGSQELLKAPMQNVSNLITGKLVGVTSIQRTGRPGADGTELYVRGLSVFGVSNSPMIIVDGVARSMDNLNPNDVESISVLKDATAAIYGIQGANGVILIKTKSGSEGPAKISYDGSYTFTHNTAMPKFLNAADYMYWNNKAREMDGITPIWTADVQNKVMNNDPESIWGETDWLDKIFRVGLTQQHNISATGGTQKVKYYTSIGLMDQEGTLKNTHLSRYNLRTNLDIQVTKNLRFIANLAGHRIEREWPGIAIGNQAEFDPIRQAIGTVPIIKSEFQGLPAAWHNGTYAFNGYAALTESGFKKQSRWSVQSNFQLEYDFSDLTDILKGLKVSVFGAYNYDHTLDSDYDRWYELYYVNRNLNEGTQGASGISPINTYAKSSSLGDNWMLRPQISYSRQFNKHFVGATFLFEHQKSYSNTMTGRARGYFSDFPIDLTLGAEYNPTNPITGSHAYTGHKSQVGRFNYAYNDKYLVEFLFRTDWSYLFAPENRKGFFPSFSAGWVVSKENFFSELLPMVDFLKIRASYGQAGRDGIPGDNREFMYQSTYALSQNSMAFGGSAISQYYTTNPYVFRYLTWSKTATYNVGLDLNMWKGLLGMELDIFYRLTTDILEGVTANFPTSMGGYYPNVENSGMVSNKGFELVLKHNNRINQDWSYGVRGSFAFARNKVLRQARSDNRPNYLSAVGTSMNRPRGFIALGLFQDYEEIDQYPQNPSAGQYRPGDIKYKDVNGDGIISTQYDHVFMGYGTVPEISFSMNMDVSYKNFYLSMLWQGVSHVDFELSGEYDSGVTSSTSYTAWGDGNNAPYYLVEGAWRPDNTNAKYPRLSQSGNLGNGHRSTWWLVNGEYLRLKNFNIGYTVPANVLQKTPFSRINVYLAGTNLLTFNHFKYVDPESPSVSRGYYPQQKTYSIGANITF